jgi:glucosylceramidase
MTAARAVTGWAEEAHGPVKVWETYGSKRYAAGEPLNWRPVTEVSAEAVTLDPGTEKQEILGFGGALTDATCWVLSQLSKEQRAEVMHDLFAPGGMGLNVNRTCIGASDYSRTAYSLDEGEEPDPEMKRFSIGHDKEYILPVLREARRANPEMFLFSSPWSPPAWMKPNKSLLGGVMRKTYFAPYAEYFRRFLEGYKAEGVEIDAVTVQNEVDAEQEGRMPACAWPQEQEIEFVKAHLGPAIRKAGLKTKIWVLDHNYNLWGRAIGELSDPAAYEFIDGIAWHGYIGSADGMTRVHEAFPMKHAYWTEGGPDYTQPDYATDWATWGEVFNGVLNNWSRSITAWNLALDEKGKPNIGPFSCGGVLTVENGSHKITQSGQYWAFAHYSKHVKRGARAFATNGPGIAPEGGLMEERKAGALTQAGFRNADGRMVVVLANRGQGRKAQLLLGARSLELEVQADSLTTLEWS